MRRCSCVPSARPPARGVSILAVSMNRTSKPRRQASWASAWPRRTLADPGRAVEQGVLVALDELAGGEVEDLGLVELGVEAEVEALEGLGGIDGLAIADVERLEDAGQAQGAQHRGQLMGQFHSPQGG